MPDNSAGSLDYGWLGQHQRPLEHEAGLIATIEMGARQYLPGLGRFLEVDPIDGGSANAYEYCSADPIGCYDLDGQYGIRIRLPSPKDLFNGATKGLRKSARSAGKAAGKLFKKLSVANSNAAAFGGLKYAKKYGLVRYGSMTRKLQGTGLQAHHLTEKRFATVMGVCK